MSSQPKIALFGNSGNKQVTALADAISLEGGKPLCFDIQLGGDSCSKVSVNHNHLSWDGIDFKNIQATYIRGTAPKTWPSLPPVMNAATHCELRAKYLREQETQAVTTLFFEQLKAAGKLVINPLTTAYIDHDTKPQLYEKLRAWGYSTPKSLTTTSPQAAKEFIEKVGEAIFKPMIGIGSARVVHSNSNEILDDVKHCPTMFQERIIGDTVRVHIVGDKVVVALKILSDDSVDSRTNTRGFEPYQLSEDEQNKIVAANRKLGLHFAAWDIMVTKEGRHVWLDCNPGGYVMWIGEKYRTKLFKELARYMLDWSDSV